MTRTCPVGHVTSADDYCDTCGIALPAADGSDDGTGPLPTTEQLDEPAAPARATTGPPPRPGEPGPAAPTSASGPAAWVAEVWVDPEWYADQRSTDPLPSPGPPVLTPLRGDSLLLGRTSLSRDVHPDLDLGSDPGVSRRHARLTSDGSSWFVEDLGSANGTYVGRATGAPPSTRLPAGRRVEVHPDERVYLGAWTRIVVRRAAPGEV